mgnify:CR=1 FL=1
MLCCPSQLEYGSLNVNDNEKISVIEYDGGVVCIDADFVRDHMVACYMMETASGVAFIEVGSNTSAVKLMKVLQQRGWQVEDVRYVIVTHVHLDHAGGAGSLMKWLPNATLLVHPYGARHMIDPSKLEAGARAVYGDEAFDEMYGTLIPVPAERAQIMEDGDSIEFGNRRLSFIDTPGHARHHFCVHDSLTNGWFSGDTFGLSYREFDTENGSFILPTTTPIQFEPEALKASVRRMVKNQPDYVYLTHFGRVTGIQKLAEDMIHGIDVYVETAEKYKDHEHRTEKIVATLRDWLMNGLRKHGVTLSDEACLEILNYDLVLNTQGIEFWLDHRD